MSLDPGRQTFAIWRQPASGRRAVVAGEERRWRLGRIDLSEAHRGAAVTNAGTAPADGRSV
jgi:hypothetical protein